MKVFRNLVLAFALLVAGLVPASAATCFWVGGTGTWDNSTDVAHWSSSTGGSGSTCAATGGFPKNAGDVATFDGASGGGTVTNNVDLAIGQITEGAHTGTLDWATNNHNVTLSVAFSGTGAGTRTLNMGNGTWAISGNGTAWDLTTTTGLTFNANSSTLTLTGSGATFQGGGKSYNTVNFNNGRVGVLTQASNTFANLSISAPGYVTFQNGQTNTITNAFTITGTGANPVEFVTSNAFATATISLTGGASTCAFCAFRGITLSGAGTLAATNSFDLGNNSGAGLTITGPSSGGGGRIIGG